MTVLYYGCCEHCDINEWRENPDRHLCECEKPGCVDGQRTWSYSEASE